MKNVAKILFLAVTLLSISNSASAQCTPNTTTPNWAIEPYLLPKGTVNVAYSQTLYYKAGSDTNVYYPGLGNIKVYIDSMKITGVKGLPWGFSYSCHNSGCRVLGGESGCATVSGITSVKGENPLVVYVTIWGYTILLGRYPVQSNDSIERYSLDFDWATGIAQLNEREQISVFPNPAKEQLQLKLQSRSASATVSICDLNGREVLRTLISSSDTSVPLTGLPSGMYSVSVDTGNKVLRRKFMIE